MGDNNKEFVSHKSSLPVDMLGKVLFDVEGKCFIIAPKSYKAWGLFTRKKLEGSELAVDIGANLNKAFQDAARAAVQQWLEQDVRKALDATVSLAQPFLDRCIVEGEKQFRKDFVEKLGFQGEKVWRNILTDQFEKIGEIYQHATKKKTALISSGIIPPGVRLSWQLVTENATFDLFCIEMPPETRNVHILGEYRRLAFPWMILMVVFRNGHLLDLSAFYTARELDSYTVELCMPNLPNVFNEWPYRVCLGSDLPVIKMSDSHWTKTINDLFWGREFIYHGANSMRLYEDARSRIPEVASLDAWENTSRTSPEKMIELPWLKLGKTIGEHSQALLEAHAKSNSVPKKEKDYDFSEKQRDLIARFGEKLRDELHFLGAHFVVPPNVKSMAADFASKQFESTAQSLEESLIARSPGVASRAANECLNNERVKKWREDDE